MIFLKGGGKYYILLEHTGEEEGKIYSEDVNIYSFLEFSTGPIKIRIIGIHD